MFATWSATEIAFLLVAIIQTVFAVIWALGAWLVKATRRAAIYWSIWASLSAIIWLVLAAHLDSPPLLGVLAGVLGVMALQRGIRIFVGFESSLPTHALLLTVVVIANWLGTNNEFRSWQAFVNFGVLAWLYLHIALDLYKYGSTIGRFRWAWLLSLPTIFGGLGYGARALRAITQPESVLAEMSAHSALNVNAALGFVVLVLALHATLVVLVVARLVAELRRLSHHDGLTGLLNRRAMEELLDTQIIRSQRTNANFVVMMLDLDHFKRINDQHGHAVGDLALKHVSSVLGSALQDADRLARFGGEEFVVLMANANIDQAYAVADRLRELLSATPLTHDRLRVPLSVSIGVAQWLIDEDPSHLLSRADAALFQAKVMGRNRVIRAVSSVPPIGETAMT
jgi:diguanylate cyclase (GGDEF)-like protein